MISYIGGVTDVKGIQYGYRFALPNGTLVLYNGSQPERWMVTDKCWRQVPIQQADINDCIALGKEKGLFPDNRILLPLIMVMG